MDELKLINLSVLSRITGVNYYKLTRWYDGKDKALTEEQKKVCKEAIQKVTKKFNKKLEE